MTDDMAELERKLNDHIAHCDERFRRGEHQFGLILASLDANTKAVEELTRNTAGVVQAYEDVQSTARVGSAVWHFIVWCIKAGGVLAAVGYGLHWIVEHFKQHPGQ